MATRQDFGLEEPFLRGDTIPFYTTFREKDTGIPLDLTGKDVWLTVKLAPSDTDAQAAFQQKLSGLTDDGIAALAIPSTSTRNFEPTSYLYDIQVVDPSEQEPIVTTYLYGKLKFAADITRGA